jgi:hypothetical protein
MKSICKTREPIEVFVVKTTQLTSKTLTHGLNMRRTCHRETKTAFGAHGEPMIFVV